MAIEIYALVMFDLQPRKRAKRPVTLPADDNSDAWDRLEAGEVRDIEYRFCRLKLLQPPICTRKRNGILRTTVPLPKWEVVEEIYVLKNADELGWTFNWDLGTLEEQREKDRRNWNNFLERHSFKFPGQKPDIHNPTFLPFGRRVDDRRLTSEQMYWLFPEFMKADEAGDPMPKAIMLDYIREKMES